MKSAPLIKDLKIVERLKRLRDFDRKRTDYDDDNTDDGDDDDDDDEF